MAVVTGSVLEVAKRRSKDVNIWKMHHINVHEAIPIIKMQGCVIKWLSTVIDLGMGSPCLDQ